MWIVLKRNATPRADGKEWSWLRESAHMTETDANARAANVRRNGWECKIVFEPEATGI
jgi:hypothetical protein